QWVNDHDIRLWDRQMTTRGNAGIDLTVFYRPGELDEVFAIVENIKADFLDPVGRRRAQQPLELAVLGLRDLDCVSRTVLRQVAEEDEVFAGCVLWRQFGIGLLPAVTACGVNFLAAVLRAHFGKLVAAHLLGGGGVGFLRAFGSKPHFHLAPGLIHCSILPIAASESPLLLPPCGIRGSSSPLTRKTRWLSSGFSGTITFSLGVPCISLAKEVRSSLPRVRPGRPWPWQPTQLATRIGATSFRKLIPVAVEALFPASVFLAAGAFVALFLVFSAESAAPLAVARRAFLVIADLERALRPGWGMSPFSSGTCMSGSC